MRTVAQVVSAALLLVTAVGCATTGPRLPSAEEAQAELEARAAALEATPMPAEYERLPAALRSFLEELPSTTDVAGLHVAALALGGEPASELEAELRRALPPARAPELAGPGREELLRATLLALQALEFSGFKGPDGFGPSTRAGVASSPVRRVRHRLIARSIAAGGRARDFGASFLAVERRLYGAIDEAEQLLLAGLALAGPEGTADLENARFWLLLGDGQFERADALLARLPRPLTEEERARLSDERPRAARRRELLALPPSAEHERELAQIELGLSQPFAAIARLDRAIAAWPDDARLVDQRYYAAAFELGPAATFEVQRLLDAASRPIADERTWELRSFATCLSVIRTASERTAAGESPDALRLAREAFERLLERGGPALERDAPGLSLLLQLQLRTLRAFEPGGPPGLHPFAYAREVLNLAVANPTCTPCWHAALPVASLASIESFEPLLIQPVASPALLARPELQRALLAARLEALLRTAFGQPVLDAKLRTVALRDAPAAARPAAEAYAESVTIYARVLRGELAAAEGGAKLEATASRGLASTPPKLLVDGLQNFRLIGLYLQGRFEEATVAGAEAFPAADGSRKAPARLNALIAAVRLGRQPGATADALAQLRGSLRPVEPLDDVMAVIRVTTALEAQLRALATKGRPKKGSKEADGTLDLGGLSREGMIALQLGVVRSFGVDFSCSSDFDPAGAGSVRLGLEVEFHAWLLATLVPGVLAPAPGPQ